MLTPESNPFFAPNTLAFFNCLQYLSCSLCSPPKAWTVLIEDKTSSATDPATAYSFCSLLVNSDKSYRGETGSIPQKPYSRKMMKQEAFLNSKYGRWMVKQEVFLGSMYSGLIVKQEVSIP